MIVRNNTLSLIGIQTQKGFVTLLPGVNEIDKATWDACVGNPARRHQLAEGELEVIEDEQKSIVDMKPAEAIAIVKATVKAELLETWAAEESRKTVLDAIEKQLEAVALAAKKAEPEGDDEEGDDDKEE